MTAPLPPSQLIGKVKDFLVLGVVSEANKLLELDAKDHPENYDIEELTGNESEVIEMDLMLGVADLHTTAESAISSCQPVIRLAAEGSETDSYESSADDDSDDDCDDGNDGKQPLPLIQKSICGKDNIHEKQKVNPHSKRRPRIVELS